MGRFTWRDSKGEAHMSCNKMCADTHKCDPDKCQYFNAVEQLAILEDKIECNDIIKTPCRIGDGAWGIRNYKGKRHVQYGIVSEMYLGNDMALIVVIKHVCRGKFGKEIFASEAEAKAALKKIELLERC